jgi:hypothetical protein
VTVLLEKIAILEDGTIRHNTKKVAEILYKLLLEGKEEQNTNPFPEMGESGA